jgi:hypothetical protein
VRRGATTFHPFVVCAASVAAFSLFLALIDASAQDRTYDRAFPQSKAALERILSQMQDSMSGRLPVLDGFTLSSDHPLSWYRSGYFQATTQVTPTSSGGSIVRVGAVVTARYFDPVSSRSEYQRLTSNGRIETDILEELSEKLAAVPPTQVPGGDKNGAGTINPKAEPSGKASAPAPSVGAAPQRQLADSMSSSRFSLSNNLVVSEGTIPTAVTHNETDPKQNALRAELDQLQEVVKNQVHPNDLVAVKKSGTAVVDAASLNAKTLFLASAHDEFEILDFNQDWVHVRVSGLSRGWIWRNELEMPEGIPDTQAGPAPPTASDLFHVTRDELAPFPGDWEPLRGKQVRIISVQESDEASQSNSPRMKLEFAKAVFDKKYSELVRNSPSVAGITLIFDSSEGGIIASTASVLEKWKEGAFSDAALWQHCYFDPPEPLVASVPSPSE